jgi:DNA-binding NarL/FixJ family response regulator
VLKFIQYIYSPAIPGPSGGNGLKKLSWLFYGRSLERNQVKPYKIILADDHVLVRQGIKRIIQEDNDMEVVGEAGDGQELLELLEKITPDLVILDISMPRLRGLEAAEIVKKRYPGTKILILSMHRSKEYLRQALAAGVDGYLLKEDADVALFTAIKAVRAGNTFVSPLLQE